MDLVVRELMITNRELFGPCGEVLEWTSKRSLNDEVSDIGI